MPVLNSLPSKKLAFLASITAITSLSLLSGCATHVSSSHAVDYGHRASHHSHVAVGVHGRGGGKVLGALIVGGLIGHALTEAAHQESGEDSINNDPLNKDSLNKETRLDSSLASTKRARTEANEMVNGYTIEQNDSEYAADSTQQNADEIIQNHKAQVVNWKQIGKDGHCYLMQVSNGITDVVSQLPDSSCDS